MPANGSAQHVQFYFDPICPWAWRTSLWIREVAKVRPIDVEWKFLSLDLANRAAGNPPKEGHLRSWKPLRAMALARRQGGVAAVDRLYLAVGRARHERGQLLDDEEMLAVALAEAELDGGLLAAALGDPTTEQEIREEHDGIARAGGFGVPTLVVDEARPLFGPVIDAVPTGEAAGEMWDHVDWLMEHPNFLELKRARP
jgi:2-hydroxychromene-2-carboxylate isomerase